MRATVDEKLQSTLETRLGQSFQLVSERLEAVQRGLGEMQALAAGVGDLKRVLTNVKTRGTFGEVQLGALLEQILVAEQYAANVATVPGSADRVEYAIRLPGTEEGSPVWLPIDAKYPIEDYQRLLDFQDAADAEGALIAGKALELRVREEAKRIHTKYVAPPHTTDFAILFLPTEGLYAEVIRRPGLSDQLQREYRVTIAGPTTLTALLNSLQMGFRTLAIEKRSSEVWQVLGAVKNEFSKFGTVLEKTRKQLDTVRNSIDNAGTRTRAIERKLRGVESLTGDQSQALLELPADLDEAETEAAPDQSED
jgi:DNA recombination protein RmuC